LTFFLKCNILGKITLILFGGKSLAIGDIIVGVDIGSSKVSTIVGEVNNFNQVEVIRSSGS